MLSAGLGIHYQSVSINVTYNLIEHICTECNYIRRAQRRPCLHVLSVNKRVQKYAHHIRLMKALKHNMGQVLQSWESARLHWLIPLHRKSKTDFLSQNFLLCVQSQTTRTK